MVVDQLGLDVRLTVRSGQESWSVDSPLDRDEREIVFFESPGTYTIEVSSREFTGASGGHRIGFHLRRDEAAPAAAWRLLSRAGRANSSEDWPGALQSYLAAADAAQGSGDTRLQAFALYSAARLHYLWLGAWLDAASASRSASALYRAIGEPTLAAASEHQEAAALMELAAEAESSQFSERQAEAQCMYDDALSLLERARGTYVDRELWYEAAKVANNVGLTYFYKGDWEAARREWRNAAQRFRQLREWAGEHQALGNLAVVDGEDGYLADAGASFRRILDTLPAEGVATVRADTLDNLASSYRGLGEIEQALQTFSAALDIQQALGDASGEARSLGGIGETYFSVGEFDLAQRYLRQALAVAENANDARSSISILRFLGSIAYLQKRYQEARDFHDQAVALTSSSRVLSQLLTLLARDLRALGDRDAALATAERARRTAEETQSPRLVAEAQIEIGMMRRLLGEYDDAESVFNEALETFSELGLGVQQADAWYGLALTARSSGQPALARTYVDRAVARVEAVRGQLVNPELRAFYAAKRHEYYELQIALRVEQYRMDPANNPEKLREALTLSESVRARMTLDLLNEAAIDLRQRIDPELSSRRTALYAELAQLRRHRDRLLHDRRSSTEQVDSAVQRIAAVETELNLLEIRIRETTPGFADLTSPVTLDAEGIQRALGPGTVLLQYYLGEEQSFLWVVRENSLDLVGLPPGPQVEQLARRVFDDLRSYDTADRQDQADDLSKLAAMVLVPAGDHLRDRRVLVAADGALQYVPFSALPVDGRVPGPAAEFVVVPSVSAFSATQQVDPAPKWLAVFSDPVFGRDDPRLGQHRGQVVRPPGDGLTRSAPLQRLPATAREARAISALVPEESRMTVSGFAASRETVLSGDLKSYRLVHFATHGRIDAQTPAMSELVLSQFGREGEPVNGALRLHDIYNLELNADLVVLSACDTALGREIRGEGLVGFSQGFFYAGARRLIATLWQVSDRASAELMKRFYEILIVEGRHPAAALREAQRSIASERRWRDPYFWSAFVMLGDWR